MTLTVKNKKPTKSAKRPKKLTKKTVLSLQRQDATHQKFADKANKMLAALRSGEKTNIRPANEISPRPMPQFNICSMNIDVFSPIDDTSACLSSVEDMLNEFEQ